MPIYEYECNSCGHRYEKKQSFYDDTKACCPLCEGKSRRIIYPAPIIFKGNGFYVTDHRPTQAKNPASESKEGKKDSPPTKDKSESTATKS